MGTLTKTRCAVVGAGQLDNLNLLKFNIFENDFVIAADGGYKKCLEAGISPNLIVGDFDSSEIPATTIETIKLNPIKDSTDTETAVLMGIERGYNSFIIFGATGGRFDHTFANIALISNAIDKNAHCTIIDDHHKIYFLKEETHKIKKDNKYISLFAYGGDCTVTLKGFYYPLNNYTFTPNTAMGVSNEIVDEEAEILVLKGKLLVIECEKFN